MRRPSLSTSAFLLALFGGAALITQRSPSNQTKPPGLNFVPAAANSEGSVYYRHCADARAAGVAPIYAGQPGYREGLDADGDGIACEPYHPR